MDKWLMINGKTVTAEQYIKHYRNKFDEGLIDIHEFGRRLREAKLHLNIDFLR